jgi:hypothetical protein
VPGGLLLQNTYALGCTPILDLKAAKIQLELDAKFDPVETAPPTAEESAADFATLEGWIALREKFKVFEQKAKDDG